MPRNIHPNDKRAARLAARRDRLFAEYRIEQKDGVVTHNGRVVYRGLDDRSGLKYAHGLIHRLKNPKQALERSRRQMAAQNERAAADVKRNHHQGEAEEKNTAPEDAS